MLSWPPRPALGVVGWAGYRPVPDRRTSELDGVVLQVQDGEYAPNGTVFAKQIARGGACPYSFSKLRRSWLLRAGGLLLLVAVALVRLSSTSSDHLPIASTASPTRPRRLRLLVPGSRADAGLCKALVSGAALGYPTPMLVNYGKDFYAPALIAGGSHIAKIYGVLDHLNTLGPEDDDDLVVIEDGYDVWFQLPPGVLVERYDAINRRADARTRRQLGPSGMDGQPVAQAVVFSAQKKCWPKGPEHPACYAVPESSLPPDAYGADTDILLPDDRNPYIRHRQRYLNSGSCVGTVAAVRAVFQRAREKADRDVGFGSDQLIFSEIFGEQEFQRHIAAKRNRGVLRRVLDWLARRAGRRYSWQTIDPHAPGDREVFPAAVPNTFEFGIGLDYESGVQLATVFCEEDTAWVSRDDRFGIEALSEAMGVPSPPRAGELPDEVSASPPPFALAGNGSHHPSGHLPEGQTWRETPLFTDMWTGISPVAVHHNAHRDGLKSLIQTDWPKMWYTPHLRALLDARAAAATPGQVVAVTRGDGGGGPQEWRSPTYGGEASGWLGVATDSGESLSYTELCGGEGVWDEVMRDGLGAWSNPIPADPVGGTGPPGPM